MFNPKMSSPVIFATTPTSSAGGAPGLDFAELLSKWVEIPYILSAA
jgi:hypothetical protein